MLRGSNCRGERQARPPDDFNFEKFQQKFAKKYKNKEDRDNHQAAFERRLEEIRRLNENSDGSVWFGVSPMTDMTDEEKEAFFVVEAPQPAQQTTEAPPVGATTYPATFDYRDLNLISPVKSQGSCGSCWAYAAAAMYETMMLKDKGITYDLAEQYLLQCTLNWGCGGGWGKDALSVAVNNGMPLETDYPYQGNHDYYNETYLCEQKLGNYIKLETNTSAVRIGRINRLSSTPLTDEEMQSLLINNGTIMVTVSAGIPEFQSYAGGVLSCTTIQSYDHEIQLVGWTEDAWIAKNSWGTWWGEAGYVRITRNKNYDCQISKLIEYGHVDWPETNNNDTNSTNNTNNTNNETNNNETVTLLDYNIEMTDSGANGWQNTVLSIDQDGQPSVQFGNTFTSGSTISAAVRLVSGIKAHVKVATVGSSTQQVGFQISDTGSSVVCKRSAGYIFTGSFIFCEFCPGCGSPSHEMASLEYQLISKKKRGGPLYGYNGTELGFIQNGEIVRVGSELAAGQQQTSFLNIEWVAGVSVQVVVLEVSSVVDTSYQGYTIRYPNGTTVDYKSPGKNSPDYVKGQLLSTFQPFSTVARVQVASQLRAGSESTQYTSENQTISNTSDKTPYIIALSIISTLLVVFMVLSVYLLSRRRQVKLHGQELRVPGSANSVLSATDIRT